VWADDDLCCHRALRCAIGPQHDRRHHRSGAATRGCDGDLCDDQRTQPSRRTMDGRALCADARHERHVRHARDPLREDETQCRRILENRFYQNIAGALSGTQEYMAMEKLHALAESKRYDLIVVDTPPTRHGTRVPRCAALVGRMLTARTKPRYRCHHHRRRCDFPTGVSTSAAHRGTRVRDASAACRRRSSRSACSRPTRELFHRHVLLRARKRAGDVSGRSDSRGCDGTVSRPSR